MLNIENKYKAFHISFYPHTSLTAGLNISERNHSRRRRRRRRMHIHIYTCKWTRLPATNQKSKLRYHQSPSVSRREGGGKMDAPTPNDQSACGQSILWAGSVESRTRITVLRMEYQKHSTVKRRRSERRGPLKIRFGYRRAAFGVKNKPRTQKKGQIIIFFFQLRKQW